MKHVSFIRKRTVWFLLLAVFVSTGFLRAQDGGALSKQELKILIVSASAIRKETRWETNVFPQPVKPALKISRLSQR